MAEILHKVSITIKRLRKMPVAWKIAAVSPIFKKGDRRQVENYRPETPLNIVGQIFEKCNYQSLYDDCAKFPTKRQHGFVEKVSCNQFALRPIRDALDKESSIKIIAFYTDFSKASDNVQRLELLKKLSQIGGGGSILEVISDYLDQRMKFVCVDNTSSQLLDVKCGLPQGSVVGPLMFCIFINHLLAAWKFSDPHMFADDLEILSKKNNWLKVQADLDAVDNWVKDNKTTLAMDKCFEVNFRADDSKFFLQGVMDNWLQSLRL